MNIDIVKLIEDKIAIENSLTWTDNEKEHAIYILGMKEVLDIVKHPEKYKD